MIAIRDPPRAANSKELVCSKGHQPLARDRKRVNRVVGFAETTGF
jgi:hypothetical protein